MDGATASEAYVAEMKDLLDLLQKGLSSLCAQVVKPGVEAPNSLSRLAEYFGGEGDPLRSFSSERTRQGAGIAFNQLIAHGFESELGRVCTTKAVDSSGKEVDPSSLDRKSVV